MGSASNWVKRGLDYRGRTTAAVAIVAMLAVGLITALPLTASAATSVGSPDDTAGVWLYNAGSDTAGFVNNPPNCDGVAATDPTNQTVNIAVQNGNLHFIGDEPSEVISWNLGADLERDGGTPDNTIAKVTEGLNDIDDYGLVENGSGGTSDDAENYDAQTGGDITLQLDLEGDFANPGGTDIAFIVPDGVQSVGVLSDDPNDPIGNLDGAEIFIFEDAETSGMTIELFGPGGAGPYLIDIIDYQRNPNTAAAADDTLIAIDLDSLPGFTYRYVTSLRITDDGLVISPNVSDCPNGSFIDTSLEIDAVATRTDTVLEGPPRVSIEKTTNGQDADTPTGPAVSVGSAIAWVYTITNTGETPLVDLTVTDNDPGVIIDCGAGTNVVAGPVDPLGSFTCTASGVAVAGQYSNIGSVSATPLSATGDPVPAANVSATDPSHYIAVAPAVDIEKLTNGVQSDAAPGETLAFDSPVTWTYRVTNIGTSLLADLTVNDDDPTVTVDCGAGSNIVAGPLAPNATFDCTATGSAIFGQYANIGDVIATPVDDAGNPLASGDVSDDDPSHYVGAIAPGIEIQKTTNGQDADTPTGPSIAVGNAVDWVYTVTNTGNTSLVDVTVVDNQGVVVDCGGGSNVVAGILAPLASATCTASGTATLGQYSNVGSVSGMPADAAGNPLQGSTPVDDTDPSHYIGSADPSVDIEKATNGDDADAPTGPELVVGETVTWTYVVVNDGSTYLTDVTVVDDQGVTLDCDATGSNVIAGPIAPNDTFTCVGTGIAVDGQYENSASVSGTPSLASGTPIAGLPAATDNDLSHYLGLTPDIDLEKFTNNVNADSPTGPSLAVDDAVTWRYQVTNTGATTLIDVTVTDDQIPASDINCGEGTANVIADLTPGESVDCFANGTAEFGQYANLGAVTGQPVNAANVAVGPAVVDDDPSHYIGSAAPAVSIQKATNGADADTPTGPSLVEGELVTWTYLVENTGTTNLIDVTVTDSDPGVTVDCGGSNIVAGPVAPNQTFSCTATGTAVAGQYSNLGSVAGTPADADGNPIVGLGAVSDDDPSHYVGLVPSIDLEKSTNNQDADNPTGPSVAVGDLVTWTYTVTNTSQVVLADVTVTDDQGVAVDCGGAPQANVIASLGAGGSATCTATGSAELGQYANLGSVSGQPLDSSGAPIGAPVTADDPSHYFGTGVATIDIEKTTNGEQADAAPGPTVPVGDPVAWEYTVTNTGTVPLVNVTVSDVPAATLDCDLTGGSVVAGPVAAGDSFVCTASGTASIGQFENIASAVGDPVDANGDPLTTPSGGLVPSPTDSDPSHYFGADPGVSIVKSVNGADANTAPGVNVPTASTLNWTFDVENTGNVDLTNITVNDPTLASVDCGGGSATVAGPIAPGGTFQCTATSSAAVGQNTNLADVVATPVGPDGTPLPVVVDDDPANYFGGDSAVDIEKLTNGVQADVAPGPVLVVGDVATWTYEVENTGTVNLTDVTVTDDQLADVDISCDGGSNVVAGPILPGGTVTCTATGTVAVGQYANLATVVGTPTNGDDPVTDEDPSHYLGANPSVDIEKSTNGLQSDTPTGAFIPVGDTVSWTYVVTNTGNVALGSVSVTDDQGVTVSCPTADLAVGASTTCTASGTAVAGQYANTGSVSATPLDGSGAPLTDSLGAQVPDVSDDDPSHYFGADPLISLEKETNGFDADAPTGPLLGLGDAVGWAYIVENIGNVELQNVTVSDDQGVTVDCGGSNVIASLLPTESVTCTATGTAALGQYANLGSVSGEPVDGSGAPLRDSLGAIVAPVTDDDPSHYFGLGEPNVELTKFVDGADANVAPGTSLVTGDPVTWTYLVRNTGDTRLANVTVTDDQLADAEIDCSNTGTNVVPVTLAPGDTAECLATGTVIAGQYTNIGTVTGDPVDVNGDPILDETGTEILAVTDDDPANYFGGDSAVDIEKSTNGDDADAPSGPSLLVGDAVDWEYVVTNTGNLALTNITVSDDQGVAITCPSGNPIPSLAIGASETCTASGVAVDGQYENIGTASGTDSNNQPVSDDDLSHYVAAAPGVDIEKSTNGQDSDTPVGENLAVGDPVTWEYVVTNTGTATLSLVTVGDSDPGVTVDCGGGSNVVATLAPLGVATCTASGTATAGAYTNTGTVTAQPVDTNGDPLGPPVTDDDPSHYFGGEPGLSIEKTTNGDDADAAPGPIVTPGDTVTWLYTVSNDGNLALTNVAVTDDQLAASAILCSSGTNVLATLAAGATATCTATGTAIDGQYENIATVTGDDPDGNELTDDDPSHYFGADPSVEIEKATNGTDADAAPGPSVQVGDSVTWTYVVTNTGNATLEDVVVTDDIVAATDILCDGSTDNTVASLDPGVAVECTASGVAVLGGYANIGGVEGNPVLPNGDPVPGGPVTDDDPSHYTGDPEPLGNIGDTVWHDLNADGILDAGEEGIAGVVVDLTDAADNLVATATTDANGKYLFTGLPANSYIVTIDESTLPAGYNQTYDASGPLDHASELVLAAGADDLDQDFGYVAPPELDIEKSTNGTDADTAPGVTVQVGDTVTWLYTVTNTGPVVVSAISVTDDQVAATDIDCESSGSNTITSLAPGESAVCVATGIATEGLYTNVGTADGSGPDDTPVSDEDPSNYTGTTEPLGTIGDTVWLDANRDGNQQASEPGVEGVTVSLLDDGGNEVATATTDASGKYLFSSLPAGDYTVVVDPAGLPEGSTQTYDASGALDHSSDVMLTAGETNLDQDFGYALPDGVIGDTVWIDSNQDGVIDADEVGVPDIPINLVNSDGDIVQTVTTDADGTYLFTSVPGGSYTVTVAKAATALDTMLRTYDASGDLDNSSTLTLPDGGENLDQDFGYVQPASLGNLIFIDVNGDGIQDDGIDGGAEPGVEGAIVNLYTVDPDTNVASSAPIASMTTGPDGEYLFEGLDPSLTYALQVISPAGTVITLQDAGDDDGLDSDIDPITGLTTAITLAPGEANMTFDAGVVALEDGISVEKFTNGSDSDAAPGALLTEGTVVTWTYVITNTGGTVLADITVVDDQEGAITCPLDALAAGAQMTCTQTGTVRLGLYANEATVTGTPADDDGNPLPGRTPVTDDDPSHYNGQSVIDASITPTPTPRPTSTVQPTSTPTATAVVIVATTTPVPAPIAVTGANSTDFAMVAVGFILAGAAFVAAGRRRRSS